MFSSVTEIDAFELAARLKQDPSAPVRVVDVRQPREHMAGAIPGAELMPWRRCRYACQAPSVTGR